MQNGPLVVNMALLIIAYDVASPRAFVLLYTKSNLIFDAT